MNDTTVRCWLVERTVDDRNLVTVVYATSDGSRYRRRERSPTSLRNGSPITAATDVPESELESVTDPELRARYADEAARIAERHDPDDAI